MSTDVRSAILTCNLQKLKGERGGAREREPGGGLGERAPAERHPEVRGSPGGGAGGSGEGSGGAGRRAPPAPPRPAERAGEARGAAAGNLPGVVLRVVGAARAARAPVGLHSCAPPPPHPRTPSRAAIGAQRRPAPSPRPPAPSALRLLPPPGSPSPRERRSRGRAESRHTWARLRSGPRLAHPPPRPRGPPRPPRTWGGVLERRVTNAADVTAPADPARPPARATPAPAPGPGGRPARPAPTGAPPPGGPAAGGAHPDFPGVTWAAGGGSAGKGGGAGSSLPACLLARAGDETPPTPPARPLHPSSRSPAARIRGWQPPPARLCALFSSRRAEI